MIDEPVELPTLSPELVEDEEALAEVVDVMVRLDPKARRRAAEINEHMAWLRCAVDPATWTLALEIDARATERWSELVVVIARWAFEHGRRHPMKEQP